MKNRDKSRVTAHNLGQIGVKQDGATEAYQEYAARSDGEAEPHGVARRATSDDCPDGQCRSRMRRQDGLKCGQLLKIAFCGTPEFCLPSLTMLHRSPAVDLQWVVSMPDRPAQRGQKKAPPPVARYANEHGLPLFQAANLNAEADFIARLENARLDMIIVIAFAQFLGHRLLQLPRLGCFNVHASLLPRYRGAAPIQHALLNGDTTTGISIQKMVRQMDAGPIFWRGEIPIGENTGREELTTLLAEKTVEGLHQLVAAGFAGNIPTTPQDAAAVSFAPALKKSDGHLEFCHHSALKLSRQVRAFHPWPGSYFFLNGLRVKVHGVELDATTLRPGQIDTEMGTLRIGCREGSLRLKRVQLEGKKAASDVEVLRGLKNKFGHFELA